MKQNKLALVTGATGFCGHYLCSYLTETGYRVTGTYRKRQRIFREHQIEWLPLDITKENQIFSLVEKKRPQIIFHLAAVSLPRRSWQREIQTFEVNTAGTIYFLEAMRRYIPQSRILLASSIQVYGHTFDRGVAVRESDLLHPESPYAVSKAIAELACLDYHKRFRISVIIARAFNHVGAGQSEDLVLSDWSRQIALSELKRKSPVLEVGNLNVWRDFLHVSDVVRAYELLARRGKSGNVYNITSGKVRLLRDYMKILKKKSRVAMKVESQKARMRRNPHRVMRGRSSRLRALGWKPNSTALDALDEMLSHWRQKV